MNIRGISTPESYNIGRKMQREAFQTALKNPQLKWMPGDRVLDIGCGTGENSKYLIKEYPFIAEVVGFDISLKMVDFARENNVHPKVSYEVADAGDLSSWKPEWEGSFDKVISFIALHWVKDLNIPFRGIHKCLKPGGTAWILYPDDDLLYDKISKILQTSYPAWKTYLKDYVHPVFSHHQIPDIEDKFIDRVKSIGFKVDYLKFYKSVHDHKSEEGLKKMLRPIACQLDVLPKDKHEEFIQDMYVEAKKVLPQHGINNQANVSIMYLMDAILRKE